MTRRRDPNRLMVVLPPEVVDRLEARGARGEEIQGPLNYVKQITRTLGLYDSVVIKSDPRQTRGLSETHYELILELLRDRQQLEAFHIQRLGDYLAEIPGYAGRARELGIDPVELATAVNAFSFAEKLHLVDSARIRHAPPPQRPPIR